MGKLKNVSSAKKRFKRIAGGKSFKHRAANRGHILTKKPSSRMQRLRGSHVCSDGDAGLIAQMLPNK